MKKQQVRAQRLEAEILAQVHGGGGGGGGGGIGGTGAPVRGVGSDHGSASPASGVGSGGTGLVASFPYNGG